MGDDVTTGNVTAGVWLLPTYNRPLLAQKALDSCTDSGMTERGVLFIEHPQAEGYADIRLPPTWEVYRAERHYGMGASMEWCRERYPDAAYYGWLSDDLRPVTPGWDRRLAEAAGLWGFACCNDNDLAVNPSIRDGVLCGAQCYGGNMVRAVGWWRLPGVQQAGIDDAWHLIITELGARRYLGDVLVEHHHYRTGRRLYDSTDDHVRDGVEYIERDFEVFRQWRDSHGAQMAAARVRRAALGRG